LDHYSVYAVVIIRGFDQLKEHILGGVGSQGMKSAFAAQFRSAVDDALNVKLEAGSSPTWIKTIQGLSW
jgi:hypothetical protein